MVIRSLQWLVLLFAAWSIGCGQADNDAATTARHAGMDAAPVIEPTVEQATQDQQLIIFLGDSLTAGYGLSQEEAFPAILEAKLRETGHAVRVVNAGVSGDTTAGGVSRLNWLLRQKPDLLVVGLGANDGLRGLPLEMTRENLTTIVQRARESGVRVLLLGMQIPSNYGPEYTRDFAAIYPTLASQFQLPLVPFLLEGVGGHPDLNLADGIHPNSVGHERVAQNVLPYIEPMLAQQQAKAE